MLCLPIERVVAFVCDSGGELKYRECEQHGSRLIPTYTDVEQETNTRHQETPPDIIAIVDRDQMLIWTIRSCITQCYIYY
jgi:hypothetical protein